jgi:hypothetical protein
MRAPAFAPITQHQAVRPWTRTRLGVSVAHPNRHGLGSTHLGGLHWRWNSILKGILGTRGRLSHFDLGDDTLIIHHPPPRSPLFTSKATATDGRLDGTHNSSLRSFVSNETVTTPVKYGAARGIFVIPLLSGSLSTFLMSNTSR